MITAAFLRSKRACYSDKLLQNLFPQPRTLLEVLTLQEGFWQDVRFIHRMWVAEQVIGTDKLKKIVCEFIVTFSKSECLKAVCGGYLTGNTVITTTPTDSETQFLTFFASRAGYIGMADADLYCPGHRDWIVERLTQESHWIQTAGDVNHIPTFEVSI